MARIRTKPYRQGDRITLALPKDVDPELLKWINQQKKLSPAILELLTLQVKKMQKAVTYNKE